MSTVLSFIFEKLTDQLSLPLPWFGEWLMMLVIGEIAYRYAYKKVGWLYRNGCLENKTSGIFFHWLIRLIIFIAAWLVVRGVIWLGSFVLAHLAAVLVVAIVIAYSYFWLYRLLTFYLKAGGETNA